MHKQILYPHHPPPLFLPSSRIPSYMHVRACTRTKPPTPVITVRTHFLHLNDIKTSHSFLHWKQH